MKGGKWCSNTHVHTFAWGKWALIENCAWSENLSLLRSYSGHGSSLDNPAMSTCSPWAVSRALLTTIRLWGLRSGRWGDCHRRGSSASHGMERGEVDFFSLYFLICPYISSSSLYLFSCKILVLNLSLDFIIKLWFAEYFDRTWSILVWIEHKMWWESKLWHTEIGTLRSAGKKYRTPIMAADTM